MTPTLRKLFSLCLALWAVSAVAEPVKWDFRGTAADRKTLVGYRLDKPRVDRFIEVTRALDAAAQTDPALKKEVDSFSPGSVTDKTIQAQIASFPKAFPRMEAELQKLKYPARDLIVTSIALVVAGFALGFAGEDVTADQLPDWIPAENVRIVKENVAVLKPLLIKSK